MPYATPLDLLAAYPRIHTTGITHDEFRTLIERASNVVDAALARRYAVPLCTDPSDAPGIIRDITVDLAVVDVYDRSPNTPEWVIRRVTRAQEQLAALADGSIGLPSVEEVTTTGTMRSNTSGYVPVFGGVPSLGERNDTNRARDEATARGDTFVWDDDL